MKHFKIIINALLIILFFIPVYRCYVVDNNPIEDNVVTPVTLESEIEKAILNDYELVSFINH